MNEESIQMSLMTEIQAFHADTVDDAIKALRNHAETYFSFDPMALEDYLDEAETQIHWARQTNNEGQIAGIMDTYVRGYADGMRRVANALKYAGVFLADADYNIFRGVYDD